MKKCIRNIITVLLFSIIILTLYNTNVQANTQVQLVSSSETIDGYKVMTIRINYTEEVGVIEGYINAVENIESIDVPATYNGWTITYNSGTGKFNAFSASGAKQGDIVQIKYKVKDSDKNAKITLTEIKLTTISYESLNINGNIEKNISAKVEENLEETPGENQEEHSGEPSAPSNKEKPSKSSAAVPSANNIPTSTPTKSLPKAGATTYIVIAIIILIIISIIIITIYNKSYKDIK